MSTKIIQHVCPELVTEALLKRLLGMILLLVVILGSRAHAQPMDLVLQNTIITTTSVFTATNSITAGPNFTIASSGDATLSAPAVALKGGLFIIRGGKLKVVSQTIVVNVKAEDPAILDKFILHQNYPNPFNPTTQISYALPKAEKVEIVVYNMYGQRVRTLLSEFQGPGYHTIVWDGTGNSGERVSSGVYYYKVTAGKYSATRKMTLMQ